MIHPNENTCPKCGDPISEGAPQGLCPKCVLSNAITLPDPTAGARRKTPPPSIGELSPHFPQLEILELIGSGGMGAVYKARQTRLDRIVALKILAHDLHEDPAFAERFNREGRVLARLHHPNIVTVHDTGTAGPFAYLMMEYVDGVNLRQAMRTGGFTPKEALTIVGDICSALKFAHEEGILHRDIKPENVLIDSRGQVKIADFGIAKMIGQTESSDVTLTLDGAILGSPQYMAPEQIESPGDVDQRADIYSLGVVLYELLTGELPLGRWALPSEKAAIDARIDEIVLRTLAKEREARYQSAAEVKTQVEVVTRPGRAMPEKTSSSDPAPPDLTEKHASRAAITAGICVLFCGWTYFLWKDSDGAVYTIGGWILLGIVAVLPPLQAGLTAMFYGRKAMRSIRRSGGRVDGYLRALTGLFTLPLIVATTLATALITGYRPTLTILTYTDSEAPSPRESKTEWRQEHPELKLELSVEPGLVATIEFLRTDEAGGEQEVPAHLDTPGAYVITPDAEAWRGTVEFGSLEGSPISYGPRWMLKIGGSSVDFSHVGDWGFEADIPDQLELSSPGTHRFLVAKGRSDRDHSGNLVMQVTGVKRTIPGIPAELVNAYTQEGSVAWVGSAGQIDWITRVRKAMEEEPRNAPEPAILAGGPKIDLELTVAPGLVATFELVETNAVGKEKVLDAHRGFILSSDTVPWSGTVLLAAVSYPSKNPPSPETGREMLSSIRSSSVNIKELNNGLVSNFAYEWDFETAKALELNLSKAGQHDFEVAGRSDLSQTLTLRVNVQPRRVPGVPSVALNQIPMDRAVCGLGGDIEWVRYLMEALEEKMKASEAPLPPREPEPEWREGQPESHVNLTLDPGLVAEIEFHAPGKNGERTILHRGYIVASDLEPWEGKLRVGSVAGSSRIQWRIDGPLNSVSADIDPGWDWKVEPMATNSELSTKGVGRPRIIVAGSTREFGNLSHVTFEVNLLARRRVMADLPEVLAFHSMGLGESPDWIEGVQRAIGTIEMMNPSGSSPGLGPDSPDNPQITR